MNKPAIALAVVGASLAIFQAVSPARPVQSGAALNPAARLGPAAAQVATVEAPRPVFWSMADAANVRPMPMKLPRSRSGVADPLPDRLVAALDNSDGLAIAGSLQSLAGGDEAAALAAAESLRGLGAGDPWALAGGTLPAPAFDRLPGTLGDDVVVTGTVSQQLAAAPAGAFVPGSGLAPAAPASTIGNLGLEAGPFGSAVPEPATWATLLAGLALVGINLRRRGPRDVLA